MTIEEIIKSLASDPELELLMRRFAMAPAGAARGHAKQAVLHYFIRQLDKAA